MGISRFKTRGWRVSRALVLLVTIFLVPTRAALGDSAEPEALIRQGLALRQQGRDEAALPYFQKAYEIARTPRSIGQLGFAEMAVGYWLEAEGHLKEALEFPDHPWVAKNRATLTTALATIRTKVGEVYVLGSPEGATVLVNGRSVGVLPLVASLRLAQGNVNVELRSPGYVAAARTARVAGGDHQNLVINLERDPVISRQDQALLGTPPPVQQDTPVLWKRRSAWISGGFAVVGLGAAIALQITASGKLSDFKPRVWDRPKRSTRRRSCQSSGSQRPPVRRFA
jgi:hypothetical protein